MTTLQTQMQLTVRAMKLQTRMLNRTAYYTVAMRKCKASRSVQQHQLKTTQDLCSAHIALHEQLRRKINKSIKVTSVRFLLSL